MSAKTPYVFVIGFNKSGTTSIHRLFADNGIPSIHWDRGRLSLKAIENTLNGKRVFDGYDHKYNVFSDITFRNSKIRLEGNDLFRQIDHDYPNAYFLYNKREMEAWLDSRLNHGKTMGVPYRDYFKKLLKVETDQQVKDFWRKSRLRFEENIREYFGGLPKLVELDIEDPHFVGKLSSAIRIDLDPVHWKKRNTRKTGVT